MNILFILGVTCTLTTLLVIAIVMCTIKLSKQQERLESLELVLNNLERNYHEQLHDLKDDIDRCEINVYKAIAGHNAKSSDGPYGAKRIIKD
jgi:hypothetical protein